MKTLLQINPVVRTSTSTGRIMQEIGDLAIQNGWDSYIAYSKGRDGIRSCTSKTIPVGNRLSVAMHGIQTRLFDRHGLGSSEATRRFIEDIRRINPDIIHIHNIHGYFLNYKILFEFLSHSAIPVIWTVHDCWLYTGHCYYYSYIGCDKWKTGCGKCPQKHKFPKSFIFDRSASNYLDKKQCFTSIRPDNLTIVPVSEWIREEMQSSFLKDCNFKVIHNGIDTDTFNISDDSEIREKYGLGSKRIMLGVASIWSREKGLDDFISMASRLDEDETIVLVGTDAKLQKSLPDGIIGISRTENVRQLAALYSSAEAFVNPTWQDNYPTVNLEAIACGTPVITYRTGGSIEAVTPDTGIIVPQGDTGALLDSFRKIKSEGKETYRSRCREYAVRNFRKEDRYAEYLSLYDTLLTNR